MILTSLQSLDLLEGLALGLLALLELGDLDLLAKLLEVAQLAGLGGGLLVGRLLDELGLDLFHVRVLLDHLGKVVLGAGEGNTLCAEELASLAGGVEALGVEGQLALEVVLDVGDGGRRLGLGEDGLVGGEGDGLVGGDGDAVEGGEEGGGVVDGEALVGDEVFLVGVVEVLEVRHGDVLVVLFLILILFLLVCDLLCCGRGVLF